MESLSEMILRLRQERGLGEPKPVDFWRLRQDVNEEYWEYQGVRDEYFARNDLLREFPFLRITDPV